VLVTMIGVVGLHIFFFFGEWFCGVMNSTLTAWNMDLRGVVHVLHSPHVPVHLHGERGHVAHRIHIRDASSLNHAST